MSSATTLQQARPMAQLDGIPNSNGEHSSVSAYTASLLQHDPTMKQALRDQVEHWSLEIPEDTSSGHARSTPDVRDTRRAKAISRLRSPCPELHKRVSSYGGKLSRRSATNYQGSSTPPPKVVPFPPKAPRTAPRPQVLRQQPHRTTAPRRPDTPWPLEQDGRSEVISQPRVARPDTPWPLEEDDRSEIISQPWVAQAENLAPDPQPCGSRSLAPQTRRPIAAEWFRYSSPAPIRTRYDTQLGSLTTEPGAPRSSNSLEHLKTLLMLPDTPTRGRSNSKPKPHLRGGGDNVPNGQPPPHGPDQGGNDQRAWEGQDRRSIPISAVLNAASHSLTSSFPQGHPRRSATPSSSPQPIHQSLNQHSHPSAGQPATTDQQQVEQQRVEVARRQRLRALHLLDPGLIRILQRLQDAREDEDKIKPNVFDPSPDDLARKQELRARIQDLETEYAMRAEVVRENNPNFDREYPPANAYHLACVREAQLRNAENQQIVAYRAAAVPDARATPVQEARGNNPPTDREYQQMLTQANYNNPYQQLRNAYYAGQYSNGHTNPAQSSQYQHHTGLQYQTNQVTGLQQQLYPSYAQSGQSSQGLSQTNLRVPPMQPPMQYTMQYPTQYQTQYPMQYPTQYPTQYPMQYTVQPPLQYRVPPPTLPSMQPPTLPSMQPPTLPQMQPASATSEFGAPYPDPATGTGHPRRHRAGAM
jgi:hypothetical protein